MIREMDFPARPAPASGSPLLPSPLQSHNWYPAVQRCACGLNLRSAQRWTEHLAAVADAPGAGPLQA